MQTDTPKLVEAQARLRKELERMKMEAHHARVGESSDDEGRFTPARNDAKEREEIIGLTLSRADTVLTLTEEELEARFPGDALERVNLFLAAALQDLSGLPLDIFGTLGALVEKAYGLKVEMPTPEKRMFEINVSYLLQSTHLSEAKIREILEREIESFQQTVGRPPNEDELSRIAQKLADPLMLAHLRDAA